MEIEKCFCRPVNDGRHLANYEKMISKYATVAMEKQHKDLQVVKELSKIKSDPTIVDKENRADHKCFNIDRPADEDEKLLDFHQLVKKELKLGLEKNEYKKLVLNNPSLQSLVEHLAELAKNIYENAWREVDRDTV